MARRHSDDDMGFLLSARLSRYGIASTRMYTASKYYQDDYSTF